LGLLIEEETALVGLGLGLFLLLQGAGARRSGTALLLLSAVWLGGSEIVILPHYSDPAAAAEENQAESHFIQLRSAPIAWVATVALNRLDSDALRALPLPRQVSRPPPCPDPGHCSALRWWIYPTAGLALLSPSTLVITAPPAAALLLADKPGRFRRHWAAPILPPLWLAASLGLARLARWPLFRRSAAAALVV